MAIRFLVFFLFIKLTFGIEIGKVEVREQDILIPIKGKHSITLEVIDPPKVPKSGANTDFKGYGKVYRYTYLSLCYGDMYYKNESENVFGALVFGEEGAFASLSALPKREGFRLLPARLCLCFSDEERKALDALNPPVDDICSSNVQVWINYTHAQVLKEAGIESALLKVKVRDSSGSSAEFRIKISR